MLLSAFIVPDAVSTTSFVTPEMVSLPFAVNKYPVAPTALTFTEEAVKLMLLYFSVLSAL